MGWDVLSRATGREVEPGFMGDVLKSARADGALWLLVIAFCVAAPISEEFFARGFLYRGWSEIVSRGPPAPSCLSSLVWTALHLQYRLVLFRRSVLDRPVARLFALSQPIDLADDRPARPEQSRRGGADASTGGALTRRSVSNRLQAWRDQGRWRRQCHRVRNAFRYRSGNAAPSPGTAERGSRHQRDRDRHRDGGQNGLQRDDLRHTSGASPPICRAIT